MPNKSELKQIKESVETAKKLTSKLDDWAKSAHSLAEEGKDLSQIQSILKDVSAFGKISAALGIAAGAFDIFLSAFGGPSAEEQIMSMLTEIAGKIDRLHADMDEKFKLLEGHADIVSAKAKIYPHTEFMSGELRRHIADFVAAKTDEDKKFARGVLLLDEYGPAAIEDHIGAIADILALPKPEDNILVATYNDTIGDVRSILSVGMPLVSATVWGATIYGFIAALRYSADEKKGLPTQEFIAKIFDPLTAKISGAVQSHVAQCFAFPAAHNNIQRKMQERIFPTMPTADKSHAAAVIRDTLMQQWYWFDCVAIAYDPVEGSENHGANGPMLFIDPDHHSRIEWINAPCQNGGKLNIQLAWARKANDGDVVKMTNLANLVNAKGVDDNPKDGDYALRYGFDKFGLTGSPFVDTRPYLSYMGAIGGMTCMLWLLRRGTNYGIATTNKTRVVLVGDPSSKPLADKNGVRYFEASEQFNAVYFNQTAKAASEH